MATNISTTSRRIDEERQVINGQMRMTDSHYCLANQTLYNKEIFNIYDDKLRWNFSFY